MSLRSAARVLIPRPLRPLAGGAYDQLARIPRLTASWPVIRHLWWFGNRRAVRPAVGEYGKPPSVKGQEIVRYYWADFLDRHHLDITGRCLEIGTTATIRQYGGARLQQADAIDLKAHSPEITFVADLTTADAVPAATFDCFVNQFSTHVILDIQAALAHSIRILKPGGVLLVNFPCVSWYPPTTTGYGTGIEMRVYHWFTPAMVETMLGRLGVAGADYTLTSYGNALTKAGAKLGMAGDAFTRDELNHVDLRYPVLLCVRIVRSAPA